MRLPARSFVLTTRAAGAWPVLCPVSGDQRQAAARESQQCVAAVRTGSNCLAGADSRGTGGGVTGVSGAERSLSATEMQLSFVKSCSSIPWYQFIIRRHSPREPG